MSIRFEYQGIGFGGEFALNRGVTPSICSIHDFPDQSILDLPSGTLKIIDGGSEVRFTGVSVERVDFRSRIDSKKWRRVVHLVDRRRVWRQKSISGEYNARVASGVISGGTYSAKDLMTKCFEALGETSFDVSQAPTTVYPYVKWRDTRADLALADLCARTSCEVCPTNSDTFAIYPLGVGTSLASLPRERHYPIRYIPRSTPSILRVVGGETVIQGKLLLTAIAEEADGEQEELDNVSWKPAAGFDYESPFSLPGVSDDDDQRAGFDSLYRRFRIAGQADGSLAIPRSDLGIARIDQYLPLGPWLVEFAEDLGDTIRSKRAYIEGTFWPYSDSCDSASDIRYTGQFAILGDRGEVEFPAPIFGLSSGVITEPTLYLTCTYRAKSIIDEDYDRLRKDLILMPGSIVEIIRVPELFKSYYSTYDDTTIIDTIETSPGPEVDAYLDLFKKKYEDPVCGECTYNGLLPIGTDGKIAQVLWRAIAGGKTTSTQVSQGEELGDFAVGSRERHRREKLEAL